jgi:hypothetical protein
MLHGPLDVIRNVRFCTSIASRHRGRRLDSRSRSLYVLTYGREGPNRQPRLRSLRDTPAGWIRLASCQACGHRGLLPVDALLKRWGDLQLVEFALHSLRCTACGATDVRHVNDPPLRAGVPTAEGLTLVAPHVSNRFLPSDDPYGSNAPPA